MANRKTVVLASGNRGKLVEISRILEEFGMTVVTQGELGVESVEETGVSFVENALLKARHAAAVTGLPAIGDDSGLAVDALDGAPGIYSARYAGEGCNSDDNIDKLLLELQGVPKDARHARFHCAVVYVSTATDPEPLIAEGVWQGRILEARRGAGGFGYDPIFLDTSCQRSAAELDAAEKDRRSHRGQALRRLSELLRARPD